MVDPLTLAALLGAIAVATVFFNTLITMNIMAKRRKRRRDADGSTIQPITLGVEMTWDLVNSGKKILYSTRFCRLTV